MTRKLFLYSYIAILFIGSQPLSAAGPNVQVYKTATCGCCQKWVTHLRSHGFSVTVQNVQDTGVHARRYGVPDRLRSCHTAVVNGYAVEGHVPASDIQRFLKTPGGAKGLGVAGMPAGSPGIESPEPAPYSVMTFDEQGFTRVFRKYP